MQLQLQDFTALVRTQAAAVTAGCRQLIDLSVGSVLRAVLEANAAVGLWVQWLIVEVLATTRAATSQGADLDSWVADFGLSRLPGIPASGLVTFSRATTGLAAVVPVGALVRTSLSPDGQSFGVVAQAANAAWTGSGYQLLASDLSVTVPVFALTPGRTGNVQAGTVAVLSSAIPGVDAVTNAAPMSGGLDAETDLALRARFGGYIDSRSMATAQAVGFQIESLQQGLSFTIDERVDTSGAIRPGHFTVTIDDGTGSPPAAQLQRVSAAIEAVRPIGGTFSVRAPVLVFADIEMHVTASASGLAAVRAAIGAQVAALPISAALGFSRLFQVAHEADQSVSNVYGVTINGVAASLVPPQFGLIRAGSVTVTP